ncbi:MAG: amidohydrolase family protein, partial [Halobacteriales archaeon]|nr:amidohydrolase family protein [Halobacteriales archaeon]
MATKQAEGRETLQDLTIVDTDSHLTISIEDDLYDYIPEDNVARRMIDSSRHPFIDVYTATRATPSFPNDDEYGASRRAGYDATPEGKLGFMEEFGIDYSVLTPSGLLATVNHDPTALALARAHNDLLLDRWADVDDRLVATMSVANQVPEYMPEEIDRMAGEDLIAGVQLPAAGLVPPAGHRMYDPIYEAAEDHGLPIVMHSQDLQGALSFPVQRRWAETFVESHAFTFPVEAMWHVISLVCNGVPEKFPDLEWVLQEPGFEWVPWLMWRLDDHYLHTPQNLPMLRKRPSEYIRDQFYFTTQPLGHTDNPEHLGSLMEMTGGGDTILFSSDHP